MHKGKIQHLKVQQKIINRWKEKNWNIVLKEKCKMKNHQKEKQSYKVENGKFGIIECQAREIKMW